MSKKSWRWLEKADLWFFFHSQELKVGVFEWFLDIPLEDKSQRNVEDDKKMKIVEEALPLTGADVSQHRVDILPVWHPHRSMNYQIIL